jgi:hypothetical protein
MKKKKEFIYHRAVNPGDGAMKERRSVIVHDAIEKRVSNLCYIVRFQSLLSPQRRHGKPIQDSAYIKQQSIDSIIKI